MAKKAFTFEGHISDKTYAPYIENSSFKDIPEGSILIGTIDHIVPGKHPQGQVLINGHRLPITLWDMSMADAVLLCGKQQEIAFTGLNDKGWPKLRRIVR